MTLTEAIISCEEGNFVSNKNFDSSQSMHEYNGVLYYEDGVNLTHHLDYLEAQKWASENWYIKYSNEKVDREKLSKLHKESNGYMLLNGSYEDCIIK